MKKHFVPVFLTKLKLKVGLPLTLVCLFLAVVLVSERSIAGDEELGTPVEGSYIGPPLPPVEAKVLRDAQGSFYVKIKSATAQGTAKPSAGETLKYKDKDGNVLSHRVDVYDFVPDSTVLRQYQEEEAKTRRERLAKFTRLADRLRTTGSTL